MCILDISTIELVIAYLNHSISGKFHTGWSAVEITLDKLASFRDDCVLQKGTKKFSNDSVQNSEIDEPHGTFDTSECWSQSPAFFQRLFLSANSAEIYNRSSTDQAFAMVGFGASNWNELSIKPTNVCTLESRQWDNPLDFRIPREVG